MAVGSCCCAMPRGHTTYGVTMLNQSSNVSSRPRKSLNAAASPSMLIGPSYTRASNVDSLVTVLGSFMRDCARNRPGFDRVAVPKQFAVGQ